MSNVRSIDEKLMGSNKVLVTHTDLDGIGCAVVFAKAFPKGTVFFAHNGEVDETVSEVLEVHPECDLMISDLSVGPKMAEFLNQRGKVGLLDHHHTAKWLADKYEWADVSDKDCGTMMMYKLLSPRFHLEDYISFVALVQDWDVSGWTGPNGQPSDEAIEYEFMFQFMGRNNFLIQMLNDPHFINGDQYSWVKDSLIRQYERYYERSVDLVQVHHKGPYLCGILVADQYQSLMGNRLIKEYGLEYIMMIDLRNRRVSLRGQGNLHLGELAKEAGGGGHARSAGFPLGVNAMADFLSS